jgi:hypothetical protein
MFLHIMHGPVYISKHNVSETRLCLRFEVKSIHSIELIATSGHLNQHQDRYKSEARHMFFLALAVGLCCPWFVYPILC